MIVIQGGEVFSEPDLPGPRFAVVMDPLFTRQRPDSVQVLLDARDFVVSRSAAAAMKRRLAKAMLEDLPAEDAVTAAGAAAARQAREDALLSMRVQPGNTLHIAPSVVTLA